MESAIKAALADRTPTAIILLSDNPVDPTTPVGRPLAVTGWGLSGENITYDLPGWDKIVVSGESYYIVSSPTSSHVVLVSQPHRRLVEDTSSLHEALACAVENARYEDDDDL